jgi:hypothetical protein
MATANLPNLGGKTGRFVRIGGSAGLAQDAKTHCGPSLSDDCGKLDFRGAVFGQPFDSADQRKEMLFTFCMAVLNLAIGFALAAYLGGHYCLIRKFGLKIPLLAKKRSAAP